MQSPKTFRERLIGKALVGFDTMAPVVRAPRAKVGTGEGGVSDIRSSNDG